MDEIRARAVWLAGGLSVLFLVCGCRTQATDPVTRLPPPVLSPVSRDPVGPQPPEAPPPPPKQERLPEWAPARAISQRWNCIIIHHSESETGSLDAIDQWHKHNGWDGCGYHFVIGNGTDSPDGSVEMSDRWRWQLTGAHCRLPRHEELRRRLSANYYNEHGIGICLVGRFDRENPTPRQLEAVTRLIHYLMRECDIPEGRVYGHGDVKSTACPGRYLSVADLKRRVRTFDASAQGNDRAAKAGG
jgi:hypothetical protein